MKCTEVMSFRFTKEERRKIETLQKLEADYLKRKVTIKDIVTSQITDDSYQIVTNSSSHKPKSHHSAFILGRSYLGNK